MVVASTELQPCAMLANGPPWTKAGVPSSVCTRFGDSASLSSAVIGAVRLEVAGAHRLAIAGIADDDVAEPLLEVVEVAGEAEDRHHLGRDGDVEAVLARKAVGDAAERGDDRAQRAVVHVDGAPPGDAAAVDAERIAPIDVIVDQRRKQVVRGADGVEVAGEMQVDVLHRHHLGIAAAGRAALHAEATARGCGSRRHSIAFLPMWLSASVQADRGGGLALARRRRRDRRDQDQLAVRPASAAT